MTKVLLMAGGRSTRLWPISDKILLKFCGKTLFQHQVEGLLEAGFSDFVVVGNQFNLEKLQGISKNLKGNFVFVEQVDLDSGMAGNLLAAKEIIGLSSTLIVSTNDIVDRSIFAKIHQKTESTHAFSLIVGKRVTSYFPGGYLVLNGEQITGFFEKPGEGNEPSDLVNLVIHWHRDFAELCRVIETTDHDSDGRYEEALNHLIQSKKSIEVVPYEGFWQAIKYPWHILSLQERFLSSLKKSIHPSAQIAESAVIRGEVVIEEGVKIFDHATIVGPAYIGKNSVIANGSLVRESMIGERSVVGFSTEIARSYLADHVWTHKNYIGDSVIDENVSFGSHTATGNLRFDEKEVQVLIKGQKVGSGRVKLGVFVGKGVRTAINVSLMPGALIGENSWISANTSVENSIPEKSFVKNSSSPEILENRWSGENQNQRDHFFQKL